MMSEHICPSCHCAFKQEFLCTTCGAEKLKNESTRQLERALHSKTEALMAQTNEIESLRQQLAECERERDDRLSDAKHYFEWLEEVQHKLDACKQELHNVQIGNGEYIRVLEDRVNAATSERDELVATMEHLLEYWNGDNNETAMHDALTHFDDVIRAALAKLGADKTGEVG